MNKFRKFLISLIILATSTKLCAQIQKGSTLVGKSRFGQAGETVCMPNTNTLAFSSPGIGIVSIFYWKGNEWIQKGLDIEELVSNSNSAISMPNSNTIAIGLPSNSVNKKNSGCVKIYNWNGNSWIQRGSNINGKVEFEYLGYSVSMPDSNTVAIGGRQGNFRIYKWNGSNWVQKGSDYSTFGSFIYVSMPDSNTVAIGNQSNNINGVDAGLVRIYKWNSSNWVQKGSDIYGNKYDFVGSSVSMPNSNVVAIGATGGNGGVTKIYEWNGNEWLQKGSEIKAKTDEEKFGFSISMPNSNILAIGTPESQYIDSRGTVYWHHGITRIYRWNGNSWVQKGADLFGETDYTYSGRSVSMPDSNTFAIGSPVRAKFGSSEWGIIQVYEYEETLKLKNKFEIKNKVFPNPTNGDVNIEFDKFYPWISIIVRTNIGQEVMRESFSSTSLLKFNISGEEGLYLIEISAGNKTELLKVMKK